MGLVEVEIFEFSFQWVTGRVMRWMPRQRLEWIKGQVIRTRGKGSVILFPAPEDRIGEISGGIKTRERLGGRLKCYYREAA